MDDDNFFVQKNRTSITRQALRQQPQMNSIPLGSQTVKPHSKQLGAFKQKNMLLVSSGSVNEQLDNEQFS